MQTGIGAVVVSRFQGPGSRGCRGRGAHPVHLGDPAALGSADAQPRRPCCRHLYLRGISTGRFPEGALSALLGEDTPNLSPSVVGRLTAAWQAEFDRWQERDLSARR